MTITSYSSPKGLSYLTLDVPDDADHLTAYAAVQAHYADLYGPHIKISVDHLSTSPEDEEEGTVRHSASVTAQCDHGLVQRIATINVVTNRSER